MAGTLLPMQGTWVLSVVRELGSPEPQGAAKNLEKKIKVKTLVPELRLLNKPSPTKL